ncbi:DUF1140 family protein [Scopulibacillus darangshiensis]|uniref:DUF1140 family protein n=1 Tax=Scopulibacillus darangshiensis TaxID=442528 RepID=UPI0010540538|nr:DUF1140 family protein [Scopulibacillus darangshiensis]
MSVKFIFNELNSRNELNNCKKGGAQRNETGSRKYWKQVTADQTVRKEADMDLNQLEELKVYYHWLEQRLVSSIES